MDPLETLMHNEKHLFQRNGEKEKEKKRYIITLLQYIHQLHSSSSSTFIITKQTIFDFVQKQKQKKKKIRKHKYCKFFKKQGERKCIKCVARIWEKLKRKKKIKSSEARYLKSPSSAPNHSIKNSYTPPTKEKKRNFASASASTLTTHLSQTNKPPPLPPPKKNSNKHTP